MIHALCVQFIAPDSSRIRLTRGFDVAGYGPAADMWSVGVITYMLLCGQAPFDGKNDFERLEAVRRGTFSFPEHVKLSAHAVGFVAGLLFLDPEKRLTAPGVSAHLHEAFNPHSCSAGTCPVSLLSSLWPFAGWDN